MFCNGVDDCGDWYDESNCSGQPVPPPIPAPTSSGGGGNNFNFVYYLALTN